MAAFNTRITLMKKDNPDETLEVEPIDAKDHIASGDWVVKSVPDGSYFKAQAAVQDEEETEGASETDEPRLKGDVSIAGARPTRIRPARKPVDQPTEE